MKTHEKYLTEATGPQERKATQQLKKFGEIVKKIEKVSKVTFTLSNGIDEKDNPRGLYNLPGELVSFRDQKAVARLGC